MDNDDIPLRHFHQEHKTGSILLPGVTRLCITGCRLGFQAARTTCLARIRTG
jgi:hypothetical protein